MKEHKRDLQRVPVSFNSAKDYNEIFEPLLIEEFKASLIRAYEENGMTYVELQYSPNHPRQTIPMC